MSLPDSILEASIRFEGKSVILPTVYCNIFDVTLFSTPIFMIMTVTTVTRVSHGLHCHSCNCIDLSWTYKIHTNAMLSSFISIFIQNYLLDFIDCSLVAHSWLPRSATSIFQVSAIPSEHRGALTTLSPQEIAKLSQLTMRLRAVSQ
jgi:hypothetical protein